MQPLQALALVTANEALFGVGRQKMHFFFQAGDHSHIHFLADATLDRQADVGEVADNPLWQPRQATPAFAQTGIKEEHLAPIGWYRPSAQGY